MDKSTTLILEKRFDNEILLINPNNKIKKIKQKDKNPFYLSFTPFAPQIQEKKTGLILENIPSPNPKPLQNASDFDKYSSKFAKDVTESDFLPDLDLVQTRKKVEDFSSAQNGSKNQEKNHKKKLSKACEVEQAISNVSNGEWKNAFVFSTSNKNVDGPFHKKNNIVSSINKHIKKFPSQRVLILNWGVSHSPSIQSAFYSNQNVLFISVHRSDLPVSSNENSRHSGDILSLGEGPGLGYNLNFPLKVDPQEYFEDGRYLFIFERAVFPIIKSFQPHLVLVQNGLDCLYGDVNGQLQLSGFCMVLNS